ncbi:hypothetical protein [Kitasatospora sp. NPDC097643]|uniref:hypothetical protein n=1 Tax=Kitasatospora sp. NPDC097643 TaxID=3157230 RepID=UPI003331F164
MDARGARIARNVQRLALLLAAVVLLAALCAGPSSSRRRTVALLAAFAATAYWTIDGNVHLPAPTPAGQADALVRQLQLRHAEAGRVEAVPMLNHWEAWGLASAVELARGWNRQLDVQRNPLFHDGTLTAASYHSWLQRWSVGYVVLPEAAVEPSSTAEAALVRSSPSWPEEVWHDGHWRLFRVVDAQPLAEPPATVEHADAARLLLTVRTPGPVLVRILWSPWLAANGPHGACLTRAGNWTLLSAPAPGTYRIDAPYAVPRGTPC